VIAYPGAGRYSPTHAAEQDTYLVPRLRPATVLPPILFCHGSTQDPYAVHGTSGTGSGSLFQNLCELGRYVFSASTGSTLTNWANAEAISRMTDLYNWSLSVSGYTGTKVHIVAESMGHAVACRWAAANPTKVFTITGIIPVTGIQWCRDNNAGLRTQIDAAWGVTYPAALPAGADPFTDSTQTSVLATIPWQGYASSDDTAAAPLANTQAWGTTVGGVVSSLGALGHTDAAVGAVPFPAVAKLLYAHDA
jgi:predicted alpha/beta hydrolase family esterase